MIGKILEKVKSTIFLVSEEKFDQIASDTNYTDSFVYLLVGVVFLSILGTIATVAQPAPMPKAGGPAMGIVAADVSIAIAIPLGLALRYVGFVIMHFVIRLFGGSADMLKTVQVYIYGSTPSMYLGWIPFIGMIFSFISLANIVLGIKRVHSMSLLNAILATVVVPIVAAAITAAIAVMAFGASPLSTGAGGGLPGGK